jgi:hypothetical protein
MSDADQIEAVTSELRELLQNLLQIGFQEPETLMFLSTIVASEVPEVCLIVTKQQTSHHMLCCCTCGSLKHRQPSCIG